MQILNLVYLISIILVIVGGLNWASVGMKGDSGNFVASIVKSIFGENKDILKYVLVLVGVAAIVVAIGNWKLYQKHGLTIPFEEQSEEVVAMKRR